MAQSLGQWFVEVNAKGVKEAKAGVDAVAYGLQVADDSAISLAAAFASAFGKAGSSMKEVVPAVKELGEKAIPKAKKETETWGQSLKGVAQSFASITAGIGATILSLVTLGLSGTQEGARITYMLQQLGRQLAGIVLPAIESLTRMLELATDWMRKLSGAQQDSIFKWAGLAAGIGMVMSGNLLLGVPGAIMAIVAAHKVFADLALPTWAKWVIGLAAIAGGIALMMTGFGAAKGAMLAFGGAMLIVGGQTDELVDKLTTLSHVVGGLMMAVGAGMVASGILAVQGAAMAVAGTAAMLAPEVAKSMARDRAGGGDHKEPTQMPSGFEDIRASYARLQAAASKMGAMSPEEKAIKEGNNYLGKIADGVWDTVSAVRNQRPVAAVMPGA